MIKTKPELQYYLLSDRKANSFSKRKTIKTVLLPNHVKKFLIYLRKSEYYSNKEGIGKISYVNYKLKLKKQGLKLGFSIPENVFGPGLALPHFGTIIVNANAKIGANCRLHACTNIGASGGSHKAPQIGDNVYIGPGAKIYGDITIGSNNAIAANAAVSKSIRKEGVIIGGVPAKVIGEIDIKKIIKHI